MRFTGPLEPTLVDRYDFQLHTLESSASNRLMALFLGGGSSPMRILWTLLAFLLVPPKQLDKCLVREPIDQIQQELILIDTIKGYDSNDPTSVPTLIQNPHKRQTLLRIGVPREYMIKELDSTMRQAWLTILLRLQSRNHTIQEISLPTTQAALSAYYIIAPAEASSNLAKYDGVRFGSRSDDQDNEDHPYAPTRGNGLGKEVRRRILLGSYSLSAAAKDSYFLKAQKVRRLVQRDFNQVFVQAHPLIETETDVDHTNGVDIIITPTAPTFPPTQSSLANAAAVDAYRDDVFTVPASLAGLPAINLPVALGTPKGEFALKTAGMQIIGQYGSDDFLLDVAEEIENLDQQDL